MTLTGTRPADARLHRAVGLLSWCFVLIGAAHLAISVIARLRPAPAPERAALAAMRAAPVDLLGTGHDMAAQYQGFSLTMALLAVAYGLVNLIVRRVAPEVYLRDGSLVLLNLAVAAVTFAVAVAAFPLPPVVVLGVALVAALRALPLALPIPRRTT